MEELLYNDFLQFYSGLDFIKIKGWTDYDNLDGLLLSPSQLFTDQNITSRQTATISGRNTTIETITSNNGAFELSRITITSNPITIPIYNTTFNKNTNRIEKSSKTPGVDTYNTLIRYTINWSKLAQNLIFFNTNDSITEIKGDYLFTDSIKINDEPYFIQNFYFSTPISLRNYTSFTNVYSLNTTNTTLNEDRFSYCDSQYIGTEKFDRTSIVNPNNNITKENIESDINNIISRNVVYNSGYIGNSPKQDIGNTLDRIKDNSLRNFYTYGNNYNYLSADYKDFYNVENTENDQPYWYSTFKNWNTWDVGADRTVPLRNIAVGIDLNDTTFNSFYEAWDNLGDFNTINPFNNTITFNIKNKITPPNGQIQAMYCWTHPKEFRETTDWAYFFKVPYNYMLDYNGKETTGEQIFTHDIITSNYVIYDNSQFNPSINFTLVKNINLNVNAYDPNAYQQLETILDNIPYINLIGGSTTLLVLGILSLALILKIGHILK